MKDRMPKRIPKTASPPAGNSCKTRFMDRTWVLALLLLIGTLVVYLPVRNAGFIWDDDVYVSGNAALRSWDGLTQIWCNPGATPQYYPLVHTSFWVEHHLWGVNPFGYHLVNILLHGLNAVLLWRVLRRLEVPGAWWAAAIFALHPVQVESVAWITERKNVLCGLFYLLALRAYLRFRPLAGPGAGQTRNTRFYPLVIVFFLCALLSKTVACSLPAVIILLLWWKQERVERRQLLELLPLFLLGAVLGVTTAWLETHQVGATGAAWSLSMVQRCMLAGRALWFYAGKLCWPHPLIFIYPRWTIDARVWWQYIFPLAALASVPALWALRRRIGKGSLVAVLAFAGTLVPALGFFNVYPFRFAFTADHFQYLAGMGLMAWAASATAIGCQRMAPAGRRAAAAAATTALVVLGTLTWRQAGVYRDVETLWRDTLTKNPKCTLAYNNLGNMLFRQGKFPEAIGYYKRALELNPDYAEVHDNMGVVLFRQGEVQKAIEHYEQALRLDPHLAEAHNNLGLVLFQQGRATEAISHYEQALSLNPHLAEAHNNLGNALGQQGRITEAIQHFEQALSLNPRAVDAHKNLGNALAQQGRLPEATEYYEQALKIQPDMADVHFNLGIVLAQQGRIPEAIQHFEQALRLQPDFAQAHNNLGTALAQQGRMPEAIQHYEEALRLQPNLEEARSNLKIALEQQGGMSEAVTPRRR